MYFKCYKLSLLGNESGGNTAPGVYLREDPICGTQLENQSELRAPTAERAAYYLDAAIAARTIPGRCLQLVIIFIIKVRLFAEWRNINCSLNISFIVCLLPVTIPY